MGKSKRGKNKDENKAFGYGLSSRIKTLFIELHNYSFFHGPSEIRKIDKRFIGRKRIINKLKSILTNNDTKSGAYLITGYRGMGKSSFVSKVINEIDPTSRHSVFTIRATRILIGLVILSIFNWNTESLFFWISITAAISFLVIFTDYSLFSSDKSQKNLKKNRNPSKKLGKCNSRWRRLKTLFDLHRNTEAENRWLTIFQYIYIILIMHFFTWYLQGFIFFRFNKFSFSLISYFILLFVLWIWNFLLKFERRPPPNKNSGNRLSTFWEYLTVTIIKSVKGFFNYSRRVYVKINLGYDELKDIDILRLIAKNIEKSYREFERFPRKTAFVFIFKVIFSFLLVAMIYYHGPIKNLNQSFKEKIKFTEYFPSQQSKYEERNNFKTNPSKFMKDAKTLKLCCIYIDHFVLTIYDRIVNILVEKPEEIQKSKKSNITLHNSWIHGGDDKKLEVAFGKELLNLDYFFWAYFLFIFIIIHSLLPRLIDRSPRRKILTKIKALNELIDAQVTEEKGGNAGIKFDFLFNVFRKKVKSHARADIREIEKQLIDILEEFDRKALFSLRPEFICIFDELDKIEPNLNIHLEQKRAESPEGLSQPETLYFATENIRHRQHTIFNILSNLKHFLNTAKAKFIFIAGREMYDASLADVSDRNFFIGSIFHDVIYVNSFLTEDSHDKASDLTSMTESYVCQFLFPSEYKVEEYSLREYKEYLEKYFNIQELEKKIKHSENQSNEEEKKTKWKHQLALQEIEKIIFTLREFVTYLTYRSNGAPKKMTTFFENYIFKPNADSTNLKASLQSDFSLCVGLSTNNLYLKFDYYDQYTFGMISYLVKPVVLSISRAIKDYGDKLLVSTSFLVDHLFKFHKSAFSWRNIEMTPEILDINKAPQLRELISLIINNLSSSHILEIVSGLYSFKFHKKISEEISFLSKISEKEAAAFNFTLDESLSLKRHHKRLLKVLENRHRDHSSLEFINSVSFIHMIIGDLHFYDEEYNDAILEYMEAVQELRNITFSAQNASYFVILIRNMLKLGFALEKRKSYVSAFMIYGFLVSKIVKFREVDLETLGLREKSTSENEMKSYLELSENKEKFIVDTELSDLEELTAQNPEEMEMLDSKINILVKDWDYRIEEIFRSHTKDSDKEILDKKNKKIKYDQEIILEPFEQNNDKPVCFSQHFGDLLNQTPFTSLKEDLLYGISSFEGIRLIYQPLMAKLQIIEKAQLGGITLIDLRRIENEFNFITKTINKKEKFMVAAEFWYKIGDILFFKNGLLPHDLYKKKAKDPYYCKKKEALCCYNPEIVRVVEEKGDRVPCRACLYYMRSLRILCKELFDFSADDFSRDKLMLRIVEKLQKKSFDVRNSTALRVMANALSALGNSFLSCCTETIPPKKGFLKSFLDFVEEPKEKFQEFFYLNGTSRNAGTEIKFNKIEEVFIYYYLSYQFYLRIGENREAAVQMLKILYLIRNLIVMAKTKGKKTDWIIISIRNVLDKIEQTILKRALKNLYRVYDSVHRLEIGDFKDIINFVADIKTSEHAAKEDERINLKKISLSADFKEYFVIFKEISLKCNPFKLPKDVKEILSFFTATPYYSINKMYNRIIDLNFKVTVNFKIFQELEIQNILNESEKILEKIKEYTLSNNITVVDSQYFMKLFREKAEKLQRETVKAVEIIHVILRSSDTSPSISDENTTNVDELIHVAEFLISDSIFCLHEIIKLVGLYGVSYMLNHSILANAHKRMGDWCAFYFTFSRILKDEDNLVTQKKLSFKKDLATLIKRDNLKYLSTRFHYEKARDSYYSILELHREGKAYRAMLSKMFYLNDDFNDSIYHFSAAAERYRINIGRVRHDLDEVTKGLKNSELYDPENYISMPSRKGRNIWEEW